LIQSIDGWERHLNASVKTTVSAGSKHAVLFDLGLQSLCPYGIRDGSRADFGPTVFPRGRTIYLNSGRLMYSIAGQCKANWWYENNQVHIVPDDKYIQEAIVLNANTGLI
ncbi:hypothetical protein DXF97_39160, partial [Klebsiella pneumoniae]